MQTPVLNILCIPALGTLIFAIRYVHRLGCDMMNTKCSSYIPRNTFTMLTITTIYHIFTYTVNQIT